MTMADNSNSMSPSSPHQETFDHDSSTNRNDPKKRKRKRLSAVLDKLHNNTNNIMMMHQQINGSNLNNNNNSVINNNNVLTNTITNNNNTTNIKDENKLAYSTNLARSVQENAEILRNLFALSQGLPTSHPAFAASSPFVMIPSSSPISFECNNNNNNNENFASSTDKMMLLNGVVGKVKMEVKEETIEDEEDANCSSSVRDTCKTPLHEFLHHLPKTIYNNTALYGHHDNNNQPQLLHRYQNGFHHNQLSPNEPQEYPLDLSMKTVKRRKSSSSSSSPSLTRQLLMQQTEQKINAVLQPLGIQVPKDCSISIQTTPSSDSSSTSPLQLPQYYQDLKVSPIVEEVAPGSNSCFVCPICGQMFSLNDRLAKHIASRHKTRSPASETPAKCYVCEVCNRSFARSDMLTRHMRLHTGIKPYNCNTCGQVFSRSDHLSTHQRTHTGEKPYRCPQCNYAACRRDMITRHMRTHARYEQNNGAQPTRKAMKVKAEKVKTEVKSDETSKSIISGSNSNLNNNDISMFNQNSLENINELRMKLQENFLANSGLMPSDISNLKREIKIEF
ncbi:hypothetical protein PVAND_010818 [Polypedilum vanderplanki]|uniref:C2H2-type domain-containing protein n=1 Tax=Polypedilum vanderplanki TaxID=319348 RepID=A0A9J6CHN6_POLVA|nr:hypothetical protein PVAND_010818 [Polypedilum vanderplanki]